MRHLVSIIVSLLVTPVVYVLTGVGLVKFGEASGSSGATKFTALTIALIALLVAGILYSLLVLARLSPLGLVLAGLALFSATMWAILSTDSFRDTVPGTVFGVRGAGWAPASGVAALLAVPLLATIASPRRVRRSRPTAPRRPTPRRTRKAPRPATARPSTGPNRRPRPTTTPRRPGGCPARQLHTPAPPLLTSPRSPPDCAW